MLNKITNDQHKVIWIDLREPAQSEIDEIEKEFNLHIPTRHELEEIETSSQLQFANNFIRVSLPSIFHVGATDLPAPVGFILNEKILITIQFQNLPSFEAAKKCFRTTSILVIQQMHSHI